MECVWVCLDSLHRNVVGLPKRRFARVTAEMIVQMLFPCERLQANAARERLIGRMALHVPLQAGIVGEHVVADRAREHATAAGMIGVMRLAVRRQLLRGGKRLAAHLTDERLALVVIAPMHNQLVLVGEHFAAHLARVRRRHQCQIGAGRSVAAAAANAAGAGRRCGRRRR